MKKTHEQWSRAEPRLCSCANLVLADWTEERDRLLNEIEELCLHPMTLEARAEKAEAEVVRMKKLGNEALGQLYEMIEKLDKGEL